MSRQLTDFLRHWTCSLERMRWWLYALAWCGWKVEPADWLINGKHDLSDLKIQRAVATQMEKCGAAIWAVDCSTPSRAREIIIPGHKYGPKPLRTEGLPRVLKTLQNRDADRVKQANLFIDFTFEQVATSIAAGKAAVLESPARGHLWNFEQLKEIRKAPAWRRTTYDACCWGGARKKKQAMESNVPELHELQASCHHTHDKNEWEPHEDANGKWIYPSPGDAESTANLAFSVAVASGWWAIRQGRAKLQVPRAPSMQNVGSRVGWPDRPPGVMRSWVMASTAVRLGFTPLEKGPGAWFPEEDTRKMTSWRKQITQKMPAGKAIFAGRMKELAAARGLNGPRHLYFDSTAHLQRASLNTWCGSMQEHNRNYIPHPPKSQVRNWPANVHQDSHATQTTWWPRHAWHQGGHLLLYRDEDVSYSSW